MGVDQWQHAILVDLAELVAAHVAQLLFVDHFKSAIDEGFFNAGLLNGDFAIHQQAQFFQFLDKLTGPLAGLFKLLAEIQDILCGFAGLILVKQRIAAILRA